MNLSKQVRAILPEQTQRAWVTVASVRPPSAYLVGGTAIAVHLGHRVSRDLDFFLASREDLRVLHDKLTAVGNFVATARKDDTLNGELDGTKVQFLLADTQRIVEPLTEVDGLPIAGLGDLMAMKLKVIMDRGELRDYFDLMTIEQRTGRMAEEGLALFLERYRPEVADEPLAVIVRALGWFGDVEDDKGLPISRAEIERYWEKRQPALVRHFDREGAPSPSTYGLALETESLLLNEAHAEKGGLGPSRMPNRGPRP